MPQSYDTLSAAQIAAGVRDGAFSAVEVARAALEAVEAREPEVQAFIQVTPELALAAAKRVDAACAAGEPLPPLAGVPMGTRSGDIDPAVLEYFIFSFTADFGEIIKDYIAEIE